MELFLREVLLLVIGLIVLYLACKIIFGTYFAARKRYIEQTVDNLFTRNLKRGKANPTLPISEPRSQNN